MDLRVGGKYVFASGRRIDADTEPPRVAIRQGTQSAHRTRMANRSTGSERKSALDRSVIFTLA